jgi:hypothetical protein
MEKERSETLRLLKGLRFRFTTLHCFPGEYEYKGAALGVEDMQGIGEWKSGLCDDLGINLFLDDNQHMYLNEFDVPRVHI